MHTAPRASELIRNSDGSIYHLHLFPEQVADIVITVGDPDRVAQVSKHFDAIEFQQQKREFITHTGTIGKKRITVISTGIGPDNIDIVLNELHALKQFDFKGHIAKSIEQPFTIIRFGTSGSIQADIPVGTLLMSEMGIGIDNVMHFYNHRNNDAETAFLEQFKLHCYFHHTIHPYIASADISLLTHFAKEFTSGITLTAPGFYAPQGRAVNLPVSHPDFYSEITTFNFAGKRITNFEMETATIYGLAALLGHRAISLNVLLANRATGEFIADPSEAVKHLIKTGIEMIADSDFK